MYFKSFFILLKMDCILQLIRFGLYKYMNNQLTNEKIHFL